MKISELIKKFITHFLLYSNIALLFRVMLFEKKLNDSKMGIKSSYLYKDNDERWWEVDIKFKEFKWQ